jgi:nucleolar complex protein 2
MGTFSHFISFIKLFISSANCLVELYGINFTSSYQHAFVYIRQLAIHLRTAIHTKSKVLNFVTCKNLHFFIQESQQNVYSWQFVNSLLVWVKLLQTYGGSSELSLLVYPLVQTIMGTIRYEKKKKTFTRLKIFFFTSVWFPHPDISDFDFFVFVY